MCVGQLYFCSYLFSKGADLAGKNQFSLYITFFHYNRGTVFLNKKTQFHGYEIAFLIYFYDRYITWVRSVYWSLRSR